MPPESNLYLREIGRPQVEVQDNGLRKITRRYVATGHPDAENIFLDYWGGTPTEGPTVDVEYGAACLVQQYLEQSQDNTQAVLVRVYQELGTSTSAPNTAKVELGKPDYKRDADNLLEITRKFIYLRDDGTPEWTSDARIGSDEFEGCLLGKIVADEGVVYVQVVETYYEKGIVSTKYDELHNGALKKYSIRSIGLETTAEVITKSGLSELNDYTLITQMQGSGSTDYEYGGLEVRTWVYALGEGLVSHKTEEKGPVEITEDKVLLPNTTTSTWDDYSSIPTDTVFELTVEEHTGYDVYVIHGVVGDGEIKRDTTERLNEHVTQTRIRNLNDWPVTPAGFVEIGSSEDHSGKFPVYEKTFLRVTEGAIGRIEEERGQTTITTEVIVTASDAVEPTSTIADPFFTQRDVRDTYALWTFKGAVGDGEFERQTVTRLGDHITQTTIRQLNDWPATPGGFVEIGSREDNSGNFPIYEKTFLRVTEGVIGRTTEERGQALITTEVHVTDLESAAPAPSIPDPYEESWQDKDGYRIWTFKGVSGDGEIERRVDTRANGAITVTSVKNIGNAPSGSGSLITDRDFYEGNLRVYHRVWVTGSGTIREVNEYKHDVTIIQTTAVYGDGETDPSEGAADVFERSTEQEDGYTVVSWKTVSGSGAYYEETEEFHHGELVITTHRHFGTAVIPDDAFESGVDTSGDLKVTFWKTAVGDGLVYTKSEGRMDGYTYDTEQYVGNYTSTQTGHLMSRATDKKVGYTVTTDVYISLPSNDEVKQERADVKGLVYTTKVGLNTPPTGSGAVVTRKQNTVQLYDGTELITYEYTFVTGSGEFYRNSYVQGGLRRTRVRTIDTEPSDPGCVESWGTQVHDDADGNDAYTEYDVTFISGQGEISRKVTAKGPLVYTEVRYTGASPGLPGGVTARTSEPLFDKDGNTCDTVYTETYVVGDGEVSVAEHKDGVRYYHVTRYASNCGEGTWHKVIKFDSEPVFGVDGTQVGCISKFTSGAGTGDVYKTTSRVNEHGVTLERKQAVDFAFPTGVCVLNKTEEVTNDIYGNEAFIRYSWEEATGSGELGSTTVKKGKLTLTTYRSLNAPPAACAEGNAVRTNEIEVKGVEGDTCYTVYEYTCSSSESGAIFKSDVCSSNGARTITTRAYNDWVDPTPAAWAGWSVDVPAVFVDVERTLSYDGDGNLLYTSRRVYAPSDYEYTASTNHTRRGRISLSSDALVTIHEQPVTGPINVTVEVRYKNNGDADVSVEETKAHPVLTELIHLPNGAIIRTRKVYHSFETDGTSAEFGEDFNKKVEGIIVKKVQRWLTPHEVVSGEVGLISVQHKRIFACQGSGIFEEVRVYDNEVTD